MKLNSFLFLLATLVVAQSCGEPGEASKTRTVSGYEYVHHVKNDGPKPQVGDEITYHNAVHINDSAMVQSTYLQGRPWTAVLPHADSIPKPPRPDYEAFFLMSPGDSLTVYQHLDTFPKEKLPPEIKPTDYFSYSLKLISIKSKAEVDAEVAATKGKEQSITNSTQALLADYTAGKLDKDLITTESGIKYLLQKEGTGKAVKDGGFVEVHYLGMLMDGTVFDNSYKRARPFSTRIGRGQVIPGWDEGIQLLKVGSEATFFIPYEMAYGKAGNPPIIPAEANLVFFVNLLDTY